MDIDPNTITAVRTWNKSHTRATVTVTIPDRYGDGEPWSKGYGGGRAARCSYAIVWQRASGDWAVLGLRSEPKGEGQVWHAVPITET